MVYSASELLRLQANIKRDPDGYRDEFMLQYRHYQACLALFQLQPGQDAREFGEFITFVAQVSKVYPAATASFAGELMGLLEGSGEALDAALRRVMVQALILLRNRNQLEASVLLPLLFRLFAVQDKALRQLMRRHIIADLKASNARGSGAALNKGVQSFLFGVLSGGSEAAAKRSLGVLGELWRRHVWRDARTVNVIASAVFHSSPAVMAAALKFFLGSDAAGGGAGDDESDDDDDDGADKSSGGRQGSSSNPYVAPSKEEVYKAMHKGTKSSKKKKQAKLKRVMSSLKKAARREAAAGSEGFAALHLLHDPQGFAERLFSRLQGSRERWETRLDMMTLTSRVVGGHRLLLLNYYPFLQKYAAPSTRDVTAVLAALVGACHELVPPEALAPVLRQLVDGFVHDRARPEVMVVGLKAVRELCLRCPLAMSPDLLADLAEYKKFRNKEVASAARSLISAFRELNPALLAKRNRGRGADLAGGPAVYGAVAVAARLDGAELLEAALARGAAGSDDDSDDYGLGSGSEGGGGGSSDSSGWQTASGSGGSEEEGREEAGSGEVSSGSGRQAASSSSGGGGSGSDDEDSGDEGESSEDEGVQQQQQQEEEEGEQQQRGGAAKRRRSGAEQQQQQQTQAQARAPTAGSLSSLKKQLAAAKAAAGQQQVQDGGGGAAVADGALAAGVPIEMSRILTEDDFRRIRELKRRALIKAALSRHGLAGASEAKKRRLVAAAEAEADEALALSAKRARISEANVEADDLKGRSKGRKDKAERLASVMAGREGREAYGAKAKTKKQKSGGLSERQKQRSKAMPIAARIAQLRNRAAKSRNKSNPRHFKGHVRKK